MVKLIVFLMKMKPMNTLNNPELSEMRKICILSDFKSWDKDSIDQMNRKRF